MSNAERIGQSPSVASAHLIADLLYLLAAAAWTGELLALILLVKRRATRVDAADLALTRRALHSFGAVGTIVVSALVVTGLINTWLLVGLATSRRRRRRSTVISCLPSWHYLQPCWA